MKAILRWGAALVSLLLLTSMSHGDYWVSPVFRTPFQQAPDTRSGGFYLPDGNGGWTGPHYYLVPPHRPFGGILPGPTGQAIMSGNLPHDLLMSKQGMSIGNVPMRGHEPQNQGGHSHQHGGGGNAPMLGSAAMQNYGMMQVPHATTAGGPYAMPAAPYQGMQMPMGYGPKPMMWAPYPAQGQPQPGLQATYWRDANGIWQVQYAPASNCGPAPFTTIPGYHPGQRYGQGMNPLQPVQPMQPMNPMQQMHPMQSMQQMQPMQLPNLPNLDFMQQPQQQMQGMGGSAYPVHPFTRSPRDFFMWGEVMEDERARANRPFPVP